ncbi:MAG: MBL fold metallo-hydrolase [Planctomycetes bacterium]|nr:MBL fold metallo-hydrolase [Planctomycetota bacterium]
MPHPIVIFGSGSRGNSMLVAGPQGRILLDMGFSQRRIVAHLRDQRIEPTDLDALLITHTHGDHVGDSALKFCWRWRVPLVAARENFDVLRGRFRAVMGRLDRAGLLREMPPRGLDIKGLQVRPFDVPHDADGICLGYHVTLGPTNGDGPPTRVAATTDLGEVTPEVLRRLAAADVVVLESNHDPEMLATSGRPAYLIDRIAGPHGHLSNDAAAEAVEALLDRAPPGQVQTIVLAHLSQECNDRAVALRCTREVLKRYDGPTPRLQAADQDEALTVHVAKR